MIFIFFSIEAGTLAPNVFFEDNPKAVPMAAGAVRPINCLREILVMDIWIVEFLKCTKHVSKNIPDNANYPVYFQNGLAIRAMTIL
jgi:hypothetical protein